MNVLVSRNSFLLLASALLGACQASAPVSGVYHSNFARHGFFVTAIHFAPDSTFTYHFEGDLLYDNATGTYRLKHDTLYLTYRPDEPPAPDSLLQRYGIVVPDSTLSNPAAVSRPARLWYTSHKLYGVTKQGAVVRRAMGYSRNRKWLFWGESYLKPRPYYLQQRPNQSGKK
jgi:hypothetical protein